VYLRRLYGTRLLKSRNIRQTFGIEINGWHSIELAQRLLDCRRKDLPNGLFILKLNLGLSRMNIHIDIGRIHFKIYKVRDLFTRRNQMFESIHYSFMKIGMPHIAPIYKKVLVRSFLTCGLRLGYITRYLDQRRVYFYRKQLLI